MPYGIEVTRHQLRTFYLALRPAMHFFNFALHIFRSIAAAFQLELLIIPTC
jgi:hypothetical protein